MQNNYQDPGMTAHKLRVENLLKSINTKLGFLVGVLAIGIWPLAGLCFQ